MPGKRRKRKIIPKRRNERRGSDGRRNGYGIGRSISAAGADGVHERERGEYACERRRDGTGGRAAAGCDKPGCGLVAVVEERCVVMGKREERDGLCNGHAVIGRKHDGYGEMSAKVRRTDTPDGDEPR